MTNVTVTAWIVAEEVPAPMGVLVATGDTYPHKETLKARDGSSMPSTS